MNTIARFQFVTPDPVHLVSFYEMIENVCAQGIKWVQLRDKVARKEAEQLKIAAEVKSICKKYDAVFIVNDYVEIAKKVEADGVHIGQKDLPIKTAREYLGNNFIIGTSTNNIEQIKKAATDGVQYAGIGPLHFTLTKENLNPVLGFDQLNTIMNDYRSADINLPLIAIGGIKLNHVEQVLQTGVYGMAVVTGISAAPDPGVAAKQFLTAVSKR